MKRTASGQRRHLVTLQGPGAAVPDGDGGFTHPWVTLTPATAYAAIEPATTRDLERVASGTVIATASHIVTLPYRADVTVGSRVVFGTRAFSVVGLSDPEERHVELILVVVELLDAAPLVDTTWAQAGWMQGT